MSGRARRFRDLPLFWKFLLPFLGLLLFTGALGTFIVVRDLSHRAQVTLHEELSKRSLDARTALHDRELYLLESVNFASNVRGMAEALRARDVSAATELLRSVLALKTEVALLVIADEAGKGVAEFIFPAARAPRPTAGHTWKSEPFIASALGSSSGGRSSGFVRIEGKTLLAIAGPVCSTPTGCRAAGVAIAAIDVQELASEALQRSEAESSPEAPASGVAIFGSNGELLGRAGEGSPESAPGLRTSSVTTGDLETFYAPFDVEGRPAGAVAVTVSRAFAFAAVRGAGIRLALIVLGTMIGVVAVGWVLSRFILVQVRPLVAANRAIGGGDLSARVPVKSRDELGELSRGVNSMAEQLQASYETLEARVTERTEEVQRLLEQRTEFFASLSHEFRTPLAVIISEADLLEDPKQRLTIRQAREAGTTLRTSGNQLLDVINQILELAEADAEGVHVELEELRVSDVVSELRPTFDGLVKGSDLKIGVDVSSRLPRVVADRARLREVILNLVDNAVKYTPAGGRVDISAASRNGSVDVSVADTGMGIPTEAGDRIFEPFYRVKGSKPVRGQASSGLGLALAKRFVEAQGGRIGFENRPAGGTVFTFSLDQASE